MSIRLACLAAATACAFAAHAAPRLFDSPMTQDEVKAQKLRIEQQYDQSRQGCERRNQGLARELCRERARGERDIQQAELDMQVEPSADHDEKVRLAKADARYAVALVECKELDGDARAVCRADAKTVYREAKQDASLQKEVVAQELRSEQAVHDRTVMAERVEEAQYKAARQRCEMLPVDGRERCLADVRKQFAR